MATFGNFCPSEFAAEGRGHRSVFTLASLHSLLGTLYQWEDNIKDGVEPSILSILILGPRVGFGGLRQLPYVLADIALRHLTTGAIYNMLLATRVNPALLSFFETLSSMQWS